MSSPPTLEAGPPPPAAENPTLAPARNTLLASAAPAVGTSARGGRWTTWAPAALAVLLNLVLGAWMAERFGLPLSLEHTGTVLAGLLLGPVAGALVGAASMALQSLLPAIWMGWVAGVAGQWGALRSPLRLLGAAAGAALGAGLLVLLMAAAPQGGVGFWSGLSAGLAAGIGLAATSAGALAPYGGPLLSFLLGAALAWFPSRRLVRAATEPGIGDGIGRALVGWLVALVVAWFFLPVFGRPLLAIFFVPVILSVWRLGPPAGAPAGITAALLGALGGVLLVAPPFGRGPLIGADWLWLIAFLAIALYIVLITDALQRRTRELGNAAAAHRQADARLQTIAAGVDETLLFVSPNRMVSLVNPNFQELFAERAADLQGRPLDDAAALFARAFADPAQFSHFVAETLADPIADATGLLEQEWPVARELAIRALPVQGRDEYFGRLYLLRDRTREREIEQLYRRVTTVVNEDLRAPAARMRALALTLLDGGGGDLSDAQVRLLTTLRTNADRQLLLIEQMNEAARLESEQVRLNLAQVDLRALIQSTATAMRPLLQDKKQTLTVDIADDLPPLEADRERLAQALTNLISNAHKFNAQGGWVRVEARRDSSVLGKRVRIAVSDGGFGMTQADQKRLFQRFFRVESELTRGIAGTGLGLTMVAAIVRLHGGEVEVDSWPGRGSTFAMTLPLSRAAPVAAPMSLAAADAVDAADAADAPPTLDVPTLAEPATVAPADTVAKAAVEAAGAQPVELGSPDIPQPAVRDEGEAALETLLVVDLVEAEVPALHALDVQWTEVLVAEEAVSEAQDSQALPAEGEKGMTEGAPALDSPVAASAEATVPGTPPEPQPEAPAEAVEPLAQARLAAAIVAAMNAATPPDLPSDDVAEIAAIEDERPLDDAVEAAPADVPLEPAEAPLPEIEALLALEFPVATPAHDPAAEPVLEAAPMPTADAPSESLDEAAALLFDTTLGVEGESAPEPAAPEPAAPEPAAPEPAAPEPAAPEPAEGSSGEGESPAPAQAYDPLEETPHKDAMPPLPPLAAADEPAAAPGASDPLESHDPLEGPARS